MSHRARGPSWGRGSATPWCGTCRDWGTQRAQSSLGTAWRAVGVGAAGWQRRMSLCPLFGAGLPHPKGAPGCPGPAGCDQRCPRALSRVTAGSRSYKPGRCLRAIAANADRAGSSFLSLRSASGFQLHQDDEMMSPLLVGPPKCPRAVPAGDGTGGTQGGSPVSPGHGDPHAARAQRWAVPPRRRRRRWRMKGLWRGNVGNHRWGHGGARLSPPPAAWPSLGRKKQSRYRG